jgi:hypothetical protein
MISLAPNDVEAMYVSDKTRFFCDTIAIVVPRLYKTRINVQRLGKCLRCTYPLNTIATYATSSSVTSAIW